MFAFVDDSDETVKTRYAGALHHSAEQVQLATDAIVSSVFVASAIIILLVTFASY
jgi:hypothetical protein